MNATYFICLWALLRGFSPWVIEGVMMGSLSGGSQVLVDVTPSFRNGGPRATVIFFGDTVEPRIRIAPTV